MTDYPIQEELNKLHELLERCLSYLEADAEQHKQCTHKYFTMRCVPCLHRGLIDDIRKEIGQ